MSLRLNCDLGESHEACEAGLYDQVMPLIDQASIACGFHAGDRRIMQQTLVAAKRHNVAIGAHPSYPDVVGFGRHSMNLRPLEIIALVKHQINALNDIAKSLQLDLSYVKPHGALYNDMMINGHIRSAIMQAISEHPKPLAFMLQATADSQSHRQEAQMFGLEVIFEVFADRCYDDNGALLSRSKEGAIHSREKILAQVQQLKTHGSVTTVSGHQLSLQADSLCVHGDNEDSINVLAEIRLLINQ